MLIEFHSDEFPGQQPTVNVYPQPTEHPTTSLPNQQPRPTSPQILDYSPLTIEKSNVLLLGPSGVGKTLMTKTLARVLDVPFSMSDCTPFTQAGYIGEDAEVCVQRLLAAANYDVARAERGIICLDEIDKIATAKVSQGKDVSGEGVQQALLKIIEGTTVQVQAKQERGSSSMGGGGGGAGGRPHNAVPTGSSSLGGGPSGPAQPNKGDTYNVNTDNILFICTGAFINLHKFIRERISKGSIGFGAEVRFASNPNSTDINDPTIRRGNKADEELFRKHLPFYTHKPSQASPFIPNDGTSTTPVESSIDVDDEQSPYNTLDLTTPADLQKFGLIPELVGRLPIACAVSPLSLSALVRVLTEPRNSLVSQYTQLFSLSGIELRITSPALYEIARSAQGMGTGARGLRTVMERLLGEAMFETPGSTVKYCLITERVAQRVEPTAYFGRGMQGLFHARIADEEEEWERKKRKGKAEKEGTNVAGDGAVHTFEQYRERANLASSG